MAQLNTDTSSNITATTPVAGTLEYATDNDRMYLRDDASNWEYWTKTGTVSATNDAAILALSPRLWLDTAYSPSIYSDAGSTLATEGQLVYTWADRSGNDFDFVQATENYRPIYMPQGAGGHPYINFDLNDKMDFTGTSASEIDVTAAGTIFIAVTDMVGHDEPAGTNQYYFTHVPTTTFKIQRYKSAGIVPSSIQCALGNKTLYSHNMIASEIHAICLRADISGNETQCYVNGARGTPVAGTSAWNSASGAVQTAPTTGAILEDGVVTTVGTYTTGFNFYEFLIFPTTLSTANVNAVFSYFATKYGTTVTTIT